MGVTLPSVVEDGRALTAATIDPSWSGADAVALFSDALGLSRADWAGRVQRYVRVLEDQLWPDLVIPAGGVDRKTEKWLPDLDVRTELVVADLRIQAGIVGAARATVEATSP